MEHFKLSLSHNNMKCIEIENPTKKESSFLRKIIMNNYIDSEDYIAKIESCPFLQADYHDYLLIEFWGRNPEKFISYVNEKFK